MYILTKNRRFNSVQAVVKLESWKLQRLLTLHGTRLTEDFVQISQFLFELQFFVVRCGNRDTSSLKGIQ
jgi:hypothetical protein